METYGRAFADPEKGEAEASLSRRQGIKLKEIGAKAKHGGEPAKTLTRKSGLKRGPGFGKRVNKQPRDGG